MADLEAFTVPVQMSADHKGHGVIEVPVGVPGVVVINTSVFDGQVQVLRLATVSKYRE